MSLQNTLEDLRNLDIGDLNWDRIGVWPLAGRAFFWLLAVALIIGGTYWFFVKDLNVTLASKKEQEITLQKDFDKKYDKAILIDQYRAQMAEINKRLDEFRQRLPDKKEVPGLLDDIDDKGTFTGLNIDSIKLIEEKNSELYVELPVDIVARGTYNDVGEFISEVADMQRIVTFHNFTIKTPEKGSDDLLEISILAKTYRIQEDEALMVPKGGKP